VVVVDSQDLIVEMLKRVHMRIDSIDNKVDKLLEFKWQIISGSVVLSVIATFVIQIVVFMADKGDSIWPLK